MSSRIRKPSFNNSLKARPGSRCAGFTLLEVMIAVALIAIALVTLLGAQAQSVSYATGSRFDTMASLLAQWKLTEIGLQDFAQLTGEEGDFGKEYPHFSWKTEVSDLSEDETGIKGSKGQLKAVDLTILMDQDATRTYSVRTILYKKPKETE